MNDMGFKLQSHERGTIRVRKKFLWFPKEVDREVRWLEKASWQERRVGNRYQGYWLAVEWVD